jgi:Fic family protein
VDRDASGRIAFREQVTDPHTRDRYIVSSLMEESITSSQLEGAATTRRVAKQMLRSGRAPRSLDERMILNNYAGMQQIRSLQHEPLTPSRVLELHRILTAGTLKDPDAEGHLRQTDEVVVEAIDGTILHTPPSASELSGRLEQLCAFANGETPGHFIPPVLQAILLHFWLAYDHPFEDGNGRTARGLFYWSMLHQGYWLCEFISISRLLKQAPAKYVRAFLYTETDSNDTTYFLLHQLRVIDRAIRELEDYLDAKITELRRAETLLKEIPGLNHRQLALLGHALKRPDAEYTFESHRVSHNVVYQTARTDILDLVERALLVQRRRGRAYYFLPSRNLGKLLEGMR